MSQLNAYLIFDGTCADAMRFYETALGGKIEMMMTNAQSPMADQVPPGSGERIMHARLALPDGSAMMASDAPLSWPYEGMKGFSMALSLSTAAQAQQVFDALAEGGQVTHPMKEAFWADAFGMVTDRFGTPWIVNGGMRDVRPGGAGAGA